MSSCREYEPTRKVTMHTRGGVLCAHYHSCTKQKGTWCRQEPPQSNQKADYHVPKWERR